MTIEQVCVEIEGETHSKTWAEAPLSMRVLVIQRCIEQITSEPEQAAKKVVKVRKPRKAKAAPLTQHAEGIGDY